MIKYLTRVVGWSNKLRLLLSPKVVHLYIRLPQGTGRSIWTDEWKLGQNYNNNGLGQSFITIHFNLINLIIQIQLTILTKLLWDCFWVGRGSLTQLFTWNICVVGPPRKSIIKDIPCERENREQTLFQPEEWFFFNLKVVDT